MGSNLGQQRSYAPVGKTPSVLFSDRIRPRMEVVIFDGKEYTKASVLAERFRYTQDYLGQLCRGKKVDARLVGRAWYINLESLQGHKQTRYQAVKKTVEVAAKKTSNNYLSRVDVEPIMKNKTVKIFKAKNGALTELPMKYEVDEYSLIPKLHKEAVSVALPIRPAGAQKVRVESPQKKTPHINFRPELTPEVYLRGSISVAGLAEAQEIKLEEEVKETKIEPETKPSRLDTSERETLPNKVTIKKTDTQISPVKPAATLSPFQVRLNALQNTSPAVVNPTLSEVKKAVVPAVLPTPIPAVQSKNPALQGSRPEIKPLKLKKAADLAPEIPKTVVRPLKLRSEDVAPTRTSLPLVKPSTQKPTFTPTSIVVKNGDPTAVVTKPVSFMVPVGTVFVAAAFAVLIASTSLEILVSGSSYTDRLVVQTANLADYKNFLFQ